MDTFSAKSLAPMKIGRQASMDALHAEIADFDNYITELKFDGIRCIAYLDPEDGTNLLSKNGHSLISQFPELAELHKGVKAKCVLDGELMVYQNGAPNFAEVLRRSKLRNKYSIQEALSAAPATLVVFDILYLKDHPVVDRPQMERKSLLKNTLRGNIPQLVFSEFVEGDPAAMYSFAESRQLEGIVVKHKKSRYLPGKRTQEWIKVKLLNDDDFVICGYLPSTKSNVATLILGQYAGGELVPAGHVVLGMARADYKVIQAAPTGEAPFAFGRKDAGAVWLRPTLVCTVQFTQRTAGGSLRHPRYVMLREDKTPAEAVLPDDLNT